MEENYPRIIIKYFLKSPLVYISTGFCFSKVGAKYLILPFVKITEYALITDRPRSKYHIYPKYCNSLPYQSKNFFAV